MKKLLMFIGALALIAIGLAIAAMLSANPLIEKAVNTVGPKILRTNVHLDKANVSFLSGSGSLEGLFIGNPQGFSSPHAITLGTADVAIDIWSLTKDVVVIDSIVIDNPDLIYERSASGDNFTALLANVKKAAEAATGAQGNTASKGDGSSSESKVVIRDLRITNGKVTMALADLGGKGVALPLPEIHLTDIGERSGGVSPAEAIQTVLAAISATTGNTVQQGLDAATQEIGSAVQDTADALKREEAGTLDKLGSGLKKVFE